MGGDIGVRSTPDQGSEFYFTVAFATGASPAPSQHAPAHSAQPGAGHAAETWAVNGVPIALAGARILLVEDNELNRIVATDLLTHVAGADIQIATNGQEAVQRVTELPFDAVLMDAQMPVMDGYQATALIRQNPALRSLPIIAMTAHAMQSDRERCIAAGMNAYVTKPFEPMELFAVLAQWVEVGRKALEPR